MCEDLMVFHSKVILKWLSLVYNIVGLPLLIDVVWEIYQSLIDLGRFAC